MRRVVAAIAAAAAIVLALPFAGGASPTGSAGPVYEISQSGTVDPLTARLVERGIRRAEEAGAGAVLLRIDTPGGLDSSMRRIVQAVLSSKVPVVCWVGPPGARAASAGAFILVGCPVAAMAPGTNVGAAHPVGFSGEVLGEKITNDAAAYIRSLAERWGRNADWAEKAVRDSVSISAQEALRIKVIDLIAPSRAELFASLFGRVVKTGGGASESLIALREPRFESVPMTAGEAILHTVVDPNLAFLFFVFGIAGIVFEVLHPGISIPGVLGIIMLISSFVILGLLPVNIGGLLLIAAAIGFFVIDTQVPGHGLPTAAGIVSLVLGGLFLFDASVPNARVSRPLIVGVSLASASMFLFVVRAVVTARRAPATSGAESIAGHEGVVLQAVAPDGVVRVRSEDWTAVTDGDPIPEGTKVRVTEMRGLTAVVEPLGIEAGRSARQRGTEVS